MTGNVTAAQIPGAFARALGQLGDGRILGLLLLALAIAAVLTGPFLLALLALAALLDNISLFASQDTSWVRWTSWLFWTYVMSPLSVAIVGLLLDQIVTAVELRHYPQLPTVRARPLWESIAYAVRFFFLMLAVSLLAVVVAWLSPIPGPLVFILASGYLIAREYFETVSLRRERIAEVKTRRAAAMGPLWLAGCGVAVALNVPLLNLLAPVIGVAAFTHLYHAGRG